MTWGRHRKRLSADPVDKRGDDVEKVILIDINFMNDVPVVDLAHL